MTNLKTLAEAVKGWGNCTEAWLDTSEDDAAAVVGHIDEDGNTYPVMVIDCEQYYADHDSMKLAKFYAAANPNAVLHLITLIEAQAAQIVMLRDWIRQQGEVTNTCTFNILKEVCNECACHRAKEQRK